MAQCSQSAAEFIQSAFCPTVAVLCSEDAEKICQKNNLSFVELMRPFCHLTSEVHVRDPAGVVHTIKNWKLRLVEMSAPHPPQHVVNKLLSEVVSRTQPLSNDPASLSPEAQFRASTPWFEAYRDCFFQLVKPSDHEFMRHFLSCLIVVSSQHPDIMNAFATMSSQQLEVQQSHNSHTKWFSNNVFKYYVLLHDMSEGEEFKAEAVYQSMKSVYGIHACHLLQLNSVNTSKSNPVPNLPDPWAQFIIPASEDALDWDDDEIDGETESVDNDPENCAVDENFDPEATVEQDNMDRPKSGSSILIGPLTFEDEPELEENKLNDLSAHKPKSTNNENELSSHHHYAACFSTRNFSSAVRSQSAQRSHGLCLSLSDHDRIKIFVHEFACRGLATSIEKTMRYLNDQIVARKGLHRSFFSATKKWFGGGKPAGLASGLVPGIIYTNDAPELFYRKLGDLSFLVQYYELAYTCYHTAKRDFNGEHVWFYFAGALEMAAVSVFMATIQRPYPAHYMETAISTYLNACRQHQFATRATMLSTETLKAKHMYLEATSQLMRITGEESDLLCALLLEQSAHCFLHATPSMIRKYAFDMILAGHRYSKAAQRKHALRCYRQALYVYRGKSWSLAEDHVNFTLGRQSFNLRLLEDALAFYRQLLVHDSAQSPDQEASYLREFLFVFKQLTELKEKEKRKDERLPLLPLPTLDSSSTKVIPCYRQDLLGSRPTTTRASQDLFEPRETQCVQSAATEAAARGQQCTPVGLASFKDKFNPRIAAQWEQIEAEMYEYVKITPVPSSFRSYAACLSSKTMNNTMPLCVVRETVAVEVSFVNPLKIPLNLTNLSLLWEFSRDCEENACPVSNEFCSREDLIQMEVISNFAIPRSESKTAQLTLTPQEPGQLRITGVRYSLSSQAINGPVEDSFNIPPEPHSAVSVVSMLGRLDLTIQGPRMNSTKAEKTGIVYGQDLRLDLVVVPPMPLLEVRFHGLQSSLLCNEVVQTTIGFTNCGQCPLDRLHVASPCPQFFTFGTVLNGENSSSLPVLDIRKVSEVPIPGGCLQPGSSVKLPVWMQGSEKSGSHKHQLLFYYESVEKNNQMSYRVLQHTFSVDTSSSVTVRATARRSKHDTNDTSPTDGSEEQDQLVVAVDIENRLQGQLAMKHSELCVVQVSCVSKRWKLCPLSHHKNDGLIKVKPGETVMTQFKATRRKGTPDSAQNSLHVSHVSFRDDKIDVSASPSVDFFFRSNVWRDMKQHSEGSDQPDDISTVSIGLVVFWESSFIDDTFMKRTVSGQSHMTIHTLAEPVSAPHLPTLQVGTHPISSPSAAEDNREFLVKYSLHHPASVQVNLGKPGLTSVPVELVLHNCSSNPVDVFTELISRWSTSSNSKDSRAQPYYSAVSFDSDTDAASWRSPATFVWVGQTSKRLRLSPNETSHLLFRALVSLPGVYNLNCLRVFARHGEEKGSHNPLDLGLLSLQKPCPPSFLLVQDISNGKERGTESKESNFSQHFDGT